MKLFNIKPTRDDHESYQSPIADLDDLGSMIVTFKFNGKIYELLPVTMDRFIQLHQEEEKLKQFLSTPGAKAEEIYSAYLSLFQVFCPSLKMKDLRDMRLTQLHALLHLMIQHVTGQTQGEEEKKKMEKWSLKKPDSI